MTAIRVTTCAALVFLGVITTVRSAIAQTPGRDAAKAVQTGTAGIDGIVVGDDADARPLRRVIQHRIENPLAQRILKGEFAEGDTIHIDVDPAKSDFTFSKEREAVEAELVS